MGEYFIGIDVGTHGARAAVVDATGRLLAKSAHEIQIWRPCADFVEQSSDDIWRACCRAVRDAVKSAGAAPGDIRGVGIDATCSLVVLDAEDRPVSISPAKRDEQNVIVWMDHRAIEQADRINRGGHHVLQYVGSRISPEMQTPKLCWLKEHLPETWRRAARFLDLPDFLTYRATGDDTRSLCTMVCKWTYLGHMATDRDEAAAGWDESYFRAIGLGDLADERFQRIGRRVRPMGEALGSGLTRRAADELGLQIGTAVGVGIIDAHAGGIGVLGAKIDGKAVTADSSQHRLALIGGTSSCHMAVSSDARPVPGVLGPYYSAMIPGMWLTEGGQSASGALVDHVIFTHRASVALVDESKRTSRSVYELLNERVAELANDESFPALLTRDLHVLPYFHGNRSPRADATLRGMVSGLTLSDSLDELARYYLATIQAIAHGTRHIITAMNDAGHRIDTIIACGGGSKNPLFIREHADITGCSIHLPAESDAVLLGAAILGAVAAGRYKSVIDAMSAMNHVSDVVRPSGGTVAAYHEAKHRVFHRMYDDFLAYRSMMGEAGFHRA